jgi:hypothetical protein
MAISSMNPTGQMSSYGTQTSQQALQLGQQTTDEQTQVANASTGMAAQAAQTGIEQQYAVAAIQNATTNAQMVGKFIKGMSSAAKDLAG